jgi:hypothetical protein
MEDGAMSKASYVLLLKFDWDGVCVDSMLNVTSVIVDAPFKDWMTAARVADRIDGTPNVAVRAQTDLLSAVHTLDLRAKLDGACRGPYLLHCEEEFTRDELEQYLRFNPATVRRLREEGPI